MNRHLIFFIFITHVGVVFSQTIALEDPRIDYLERKLTFNYYNPDQGMFWINTLKYRPETETFKFKSISSENPAKIFGKKYTERIFALSDLNPYLITLTPIEENHGYLVKGDLLRIETVKHQKLVQKYINTASATPQSYVHFVLPMYIEDSLTSLADSVKVIFEELIFEATAVSRKETKEENKKLVLKNLTGNFSTEEEVKRFAEAKDENVIQFEEYKDRHLINRGSIEYDQDQDEYVLKRRDEGESENTANFVIDPSKTILTLVDTSNPEHRIVFENKSKIVYYIGDQKVVYRPSRSF